MTLIDDYKKITTTDLSQRAIELFELLKDCQEIELLREIGDLEGGYLRSRYSLSSLGTKLSNADYYKRFKTMIPLVQGENAVAVPKRDGSTFLKHAFIDRCGLSASEWSDRNESDRVSRRLDSGRELQPAAILEKAAALLGSKDWRDVAVGLIVATGRRPHEIVARAKFEQIDNDDWHVTFSGQGKKRDESPVFEIATLLPASACRSALARLRREPHLKEVIRIARAENPKNIPAQNRAIDSHTNQILNRVVRAELTDLIPVREGDKNENCKSLRAAYLAMAVERDCSGSMGQKMLAAAKLAGHVIEAENAHDADLSHIVTTLGYSDYFCSSVPFPQVSPAAAPATKSVKATAAAAEQIDQWCELWATDGVKLARHEVLDRIIDLARRQLEQPAAAEVTPAEATPAAEVEITTTEAEAMPAEDSRIDRLEALVLQLLEDRPAAEATPAEVVPAAEAVAVEVTPATKASTKAEKNAEAAAKFEDMPYSELVGVKGHGVSFARCQRVYAAAQKFNEQYPDPEMKIAINKSLIRAVDGCNNATAAAWLDHFAGDIADYHEAHGIIDPAFHNRKHHQGSDFTAEVKALIR
jgi:integrase